MPADAPDAKLTSAFLFGPHSPPKHRPHTSVLFIKSSPSDLRFWCSSLGSNACPILQMIKLRIKNVK